MRDIDFLWNPGQITPKRGLETSCSLVSEPDLIIAKFEHFQFKELVKTKQCELKEISFGMNGQFPREINNGRKVILPILKRHRQKGKHASLVVDNCYIDRELLQDPTTTPVACLNG